MNYNCNLKISIRQKCHACLHLLDFDCISNECFSIIDFKFLRLGILILFSRMPTISPWKSRFLLQTTEYNYCKNVAISMFCSANISFFISILLQANYYVFTVMVIKAEFCIFSSKSDFFIFENLQEEGLFLLNMSSFILVFN